MAVVPTARAPLTGFSVTWGQYRPSDFPTPTCPRCPYVYVPGESLTFTVTGNIADELFDAVILIQDPFNPRPWTNTLVVFNDEAMPSTAPFTRTLTYPIPAGLADGDIYEIDVGDWTYIENGQSPVNRFGIRPFSVQAYQFSLEVDRLAYVSGDTFTVAWSANNLRDGSLAPRGYGQIWVYDTSGQSIISPSPFIIPDAATGSLPSGSRQFMIPNNADPQFDAVVFGWFNDSVSNPSRFQADQVTFRIDSLGATVTVASSVYPPGGVVSTEVQTIATVDPFDPTPFPPAVPEPNIIVAISLWEQTPTGFVNRTTFAVSGLITDSHGRLTYVFKLGAAIADGTLFEVRANTSHQNGIRKWDEGKDQFTVFVAAGLSVVINANLPEYQAGATATATAIVSGAENATLTYIFEVRDSTSTGCPTAAAGTLLGSLTITRSQTTASYAYAIEENFEGQLCFSVVADDGQGNQDMASTEVDVVFGWLLVNANPDMYRSNQRITFSWELTSNRIQSPRYFYEVRDAGNFPGDQLGTLVISGEGASSFAFQVPPSPGPWYDVKVTAVEAGRAVVGTLTVYQVAGLTLDITLDRTQYARGDTVRIHYRVIALGTDPLPTAFNFIFGLQTLPPTTVATTKSDGDLQYVIPSNANEGSQQFIVFDSGSGAAAAEVIAIGGGNLAGTAVDILGIIALILVILLFLMLMRAGVLGGTRAPKAPKPPKEVAPSPSTPVYAPPTSPMSVTCRSCGSPIEITTSKRPIEVMCPKCGNTEMVA